MFFSCNLSFTWPCHTNDIFSTTVLYQQPLHKHYQKSVYKNCRSKLVCGTPKPTPTPPCCWKISNLCKVTQAHLNANISQGSWGVLVSLMITAESASERIMTRLATANRSRVNIRCRSCKNFPHIVWSPSNIWLLLLTVCARM